MRSYGQFCAIARALDVIGDRWTLLLIRELLVRGPCRYTDLREALPAIATNLLANRLRELEAAGVVSREAAPPPIATTLFKLTERGEALRPVLVAIGSWGIPLTTKRKKGESFHSIWLKTPFEEHLKDHAPQKPPVAIELRTGDEPITINAAAGRVSVSRGSTAAPQAVLTGPPELVIGVMMGKVDLANAEVAGLRVDGSTAVLRRVRPASAKPGRAQ